MFLFRSDHFFGGRFAYGFGQSLTGDAVPGGQQPIVYSLSGQSACHFPLNLTAQTQKKPN